MIRRHPHVFGEDRNQEISDELLSQQWQALKQQEKSASDQSDFDHESASNSAFYRAHQLQKEAAIFGFDWPDMNPVIDKLDEEIDELKQAIKHGNIEAISDELGDLLFVCVNLARHTRVNAEIALRHSNQKFRRRFKYVQQQMQAANIEMDQQHLDQMEQFWQDSKRIVG